MATFDSRAAALTTEHGQPSLRCDYQDPGWLLRDWRWNAGRWHRTLIVAIPQTDLRVSPYVQRVAQLGSPECSERYSIPSARPGWRTTVWDEDTNPRDVRHWWGELVDGMRDQSGQLYMRNRYYDPQTGQFTQQDPIGVSGGLNTYGFANGDPVSYADPYGLCAWGIGRDAALGNCSVNDQRHAPQGEPPQALTAGQRTQVEGAIANLKGIAQTRLTRMLRQGRIMTVQRARFGRAAGVDIVPTGFGPRFTILLQRENQEEAAFFTYDRDERSWIIAHEYGHVEQWRHGAMLYLQGVTGNVRNFFREDKNSPNYYLLQRDANIFACESVVTMAPRFERICSSGGHASP